MKIKISDIRGLPQAIGALLRGDREAMEAAIADDQPDGEDEEEETDDHHGI